MLFDSCNLFFFFFKQKTAYEISACLVGSEMCIRDSGQDRNVIRFDTDVEDNEDRAHLCGMVLALLTDREALVLKRRSGFDTGEPETLDEIGRFLGVTRERVRQIEAKAKKRIRDQFSSIAA